MAIIHWGAQSAIRKAVVLGVSLFSGLHLDTMCL